MRKSMGSRGNEPLIAVRAYDEITNDNKQEFSIKINP